ncbi:MAG TPA: hypothetical protein ENH34_00655 [Phycisphaerales bacterium]|nr:hypothetical protein [Phycisphaerales bacterium]
MNDKRNQNPAEDLKKLKEIPKWTRKYAQNRMLTTFVLIVMTCLISVSIGVPLLLVWIAFVKGNMILAGVGIALLVAILIFLIIFLSKFGGKNRGLIDQKIERWIYGKEGTTSMPVPKLTKKKKWLDLVVAMIFMVCLLGSMFLSMEGYIAFKYLQPVSAIYIVPFFVFQYFLQRPRLGPLVLICPILYAIHAILIVAGVPIFFTGNLGMLSIGLPVFGYTFLAYMIGHLYSRYALKKLKGVTHLEGDAADGA